MTTSTLTSANIIREPRLTAITIGRDGAATCSVCLRVIRGGETALVADSGRAICGSHV
jgi:hypothetical protein